MERVYFKDKEILLLGTAHISQDSIDLLMVTALANLGATIGTLIAFPYLLTLLG